MPLDPQVAHMLEAAGASGLDPFRGDVSRLTAVEMRARVAALPPVPPSEPIHRVEDYMVIADGHRVPVRVFWPSAISEPAPAVVFFHGGGWVIGLLDFHDDLVRRLANRSGAVFALVDYRLAPEHPYPMAVDDCFAATRWVFDHASELGVDAGRVAVAGDSAGGNLAAVVALRARDAGGPAIAMQVLIYPCTDLDPGRWPSMSANGHGYSITADTLRWFYAQYVGAERCRDPFAAPIHAPDLSNLPPALVITAEFDPLRDEGEAYADRLRDAGVKVARRRYDGMIHGFLPKAALLDGAAAAQDEIARIIGDTLQRGHVSLV